MLNYTEISKKRGQTNWADPGEGLHDLSGNLTYLELFNSLTTEKQTTKFSSANFQKILNPSYTILRIQRLEGK